MENVISREVWSMPRSNDPIQMDTERAEQVHLNYMFIICICQTF